MEDCSRLAIIWRALWGEPEPMIETAKKQVDALRKGDQFGQTMEQMVKGFEE